MLQKRVWPKIPIIFGVIIAAAGFYFLHGYAVAEKQHPIAAMAIELSPTLADERDHLGIALALRDQIYNNVEIGPSPEDLDWLDVESIYADSVVGTSYGHECGGRAILYLAALKAFGIQGRYVGLFTSINKVDPARTLVHASTEVFINGRWIVMDAHYNISLRDTAGRRIGWLEAQRLRASGRKVIVSRDGFETKPDVSIEHYLAKYRSSLRELTQYIVVGIDHTSDQARPVAATGEWDGELRYIDKSVFDVLTSAEGPVYQSLLLSSDTTQ